MWFRSLFDSLARSSRGRRPLRGARHAASRKQQARRLLLEGLEDRRVMAFGAGASYTVGDSPGAFISGDFNADGQPDLVSASYSTSSVSVLLGKPDGTFQAAQTSPTGSGPQSLATGDINGDTKLDLVTANAGNVSVLLGNGSGGFAAPVSVSVSSTPSSVAVGDFNADGKMDLAVGGNTSYYVPPWGGCGYYGCYGGGGYWINQASLSVLMGNGTGGFGAENFYQIGSGSSTTAVAVANLNGDNLADVVAVTDYGSASVLLGTGAAGLSPNQIYSSGPPTRSLVVADANGDSKLDLVGASTYSGVVGVYLGNGLGSFAYDSSRFYSAGATAQSAGVADFNGDGKADLATANADGSVSVLLGTGLAAGASAFKPPLILPGAGTSLGQLVLGKFNGDTRPDLAAANPSANSALVLLNDGTWPALDAPSITINDAAAVTEGNAGTVNVNFTVTLAAPSSQTVSVVYATADGSATAGGDYQSQTATLTFTPGQTSKPVTIQVNGDRLGEFGENFYVKLTSPVNAFIADGSGLGTILDDEPVVSIIDYVSSPEGNTGTKEMSFTVTLSAAYDEPVTVTYTTADLTTDEQYWYGPGATAGLDYTTTAGTLTFDRFQTTQTIKVPIIGDRNGEPDERFFVKLTGSNYANLGQVQSQGTIANDEPYVSIDYYISHPEGNSGTSEMSFTVTLSAPYDEPVTVTYTTADLTPDEQYWYGPAATAGVDYTTTAGTLTFDRFQTSQTIKVPIIGDRDSEPDELFFVNLTGSNSATLGNVQSLANIANDEPYVWIDYYASKSEGNSGTSDMTFMLHLSNAYDQPVTVQYTTVDGSALAGSDYVAATSSVTIPANTTEMPFVVQIKGDTVRESDEYFQVNLTAASGALLSSSWATGYIIDDDTPPTISIDDGWLAEGNSGTSTMVFTVNLSRPSGQTVQVNYATANNTAKTSDNDFVAKNGTLVFAPGETSKTIEISIKGDTRKEKDERFFVNLSGAVGGTIADGQGAGTIANDDGVGGGGKPGRGNNHTASTADWQAALYDSLEAAKKKKGR